MKKLVVLLASAVLILGAVACEDEDAVDSSDGTPSASTPGSTQAFEPTNIPMPEVTAQPTTTASGLQIIDIVVGTGQAAVATDTVTVHYTGWLEDGTTFDSSVARGEPYPTALDQVIPGWTEGVPGMQVGGKRRLIIPSHLAYGEAGFGDTIPPGATLTFDIELISIP